MLRVEKKIRSRKVLSPSFLQITINHSEFPLYPSLSDFTWECITDLFTQNSKPVFKVFFLSVYEKEQGGEIPGDHYYTYSIYR